MCVDHYKLSIEIRLFKHYHTMIKWYTNSRSHSCFVFKTLKLNLKNNKVALKGQFYPNILITFISWMRFSKFKQFPLCPGTSPWSNLVDILEEKNGADSELLVFAMTLINKVRRDSPGRCIHQTAKSFASLWSGFCTCGPVSYECTGCGLRLFGSFLCLSWHNPSSWMIGWYGWLQNLKFFFNWKFLWLTFNGVRYRNRAKWAFPGSYVHIEQLRERKEKNHLNNVLTDHN